MQDTKHQDQIEFLNHLPLLTSLSSAKLGWMEYCLTWAADLGEKGKVSERAADAIAELISYDNRIKEFRPKTKTAIQECKSDTVKELLQRSLLNLHADATCVIDLLVAAKDWSEKDEFAEELWKLYEANFNLP